MLQLNSETRTLVVGGQCRKVGKTALVVDLIRAFAEAAWTAIKITQHDHRETPEMAESVQRSSFERTASLFREHDSSGQTDTSRYLVAGAERSLLLSAKAGRLVDGLPLLEAALENTKFAILESSAILKYLRPKLYVLVLDPTQQDFKVSALATLDRADAILLRNPLEGTKWQDRLLQSVEKKPHFPQSLGEPLPSALAHLIRDNFF